MTNMLIILAAALASALYSGAESGAYRLNRIRLRRQAESGSRIARMLQRLTANMERFVCSLLVANNLCHYVATLFCTAELRRFFARGMTAELAAVAVLSPVLLIVSEILPKSLFQARPNRLLLWTAPILRLSDWVFWPVVQLLRGVIVFWQGVFGGRRAARQPVVTSHYLNFYLAEGMSEGIITRQQDLMARNIMEFSSRPLRRVMTPLNRVRMMPREAPAQEVCVLLRNNTHSRIPVYEERRDHVVGVLVVVEYLCREGSARVAEAMMPPILLDATLTLNDAFAKLQDAGQTMGIVVNRQRKAVGVVTMGGLLQSIFGSLPPT